MENVEITMDKFEQLIRCKRDLELLSEALFDAVCGTNYTGNELSFDDRKLNNILSLIFPCKYAATIKSIQEEKAAENE